MPLEGSQLACACVKHDANRHVVRAQSGRYAQAGYAQRAVQLVCSTQQLVAIRLDAVERRSALTMPSLTPVSVMQRLTAELLHEIACLYGIRRSMLVSGTQPEVPCAPQQCRRGCNQGGYIQRSLRGAVVHYMQDLEELCRAFTLCPLCIV